VVFVSTITTPKDTASTASQETVVKLTKGLIYKFEIFFPPGPSGLVGVSICQADMQLYPRQRDEWFLGDNITVQFDDTYFLSSPPWELRLKTYNIDDTFDHTVQVRIGLMTEMEYLARYAPLAGIEALQGTLDALAEAMSTQYKPTGESPLQVFEEPEEGGE